MIFLILACFALGLIAPLIYRLAGRTSGLILSLGPAAIFFYFAQQLPEVAAGDVLRSTHTWFPGLDVNLSFYLDGLSLMFALLITGIGTLIVAYAGSYLAGHRDCGRFYAWLLIFMASMLGLVLADNLICLFIFWELTSVSSYFLIGFDHHRVQARKSALQALMVTGGGGLALLVGLILLAAVCESMELSVLLNKGDVLRSHSLYLPITILILLGALTKSAQFPFHFWLPSAMEAPTPVSAYLHSSTMVKAGVYLVARMNPALGETPFWTFCLLGFGGVTMLLGAYLAITQNHLKRILAYSTVSALGLLIFLIGIGNLGGPELSRSAAIAFATFLLAHAFYKATLFLIAGSVTRQTGEKDVDRLGGLWRAMPLTAATAALAGLSMAGIPFVPNLGFMGKEYALDVALSIESPWRFIFTAIVASTGVLFVIVVGMVTWLPFYGQRRETRQLPKEVPFFMWLGPVLLAVAGITCAVVPEYIVKPLVAPTAAAMLFTPSGEALGDTRGEKSDDVASTRTEMIEGVHLANWHGVNEALLISFGVLVIGLIAFARLPQLLRNLKTFQYMQRFGPAAAYELAFTGFLKLAIIQTKVIQSGYLRTYLRIIIMVTITLAGWQLFSLTKWPFWGDWPTAGLGDFIYQNLYAILIAVLILGGTGCAVYTGSQLTAIAALGVVGYGVAMIYVINGAPDLAITQFLVETLIVILLVLVFYHMPQFSRISGVPNRIRDVAVATAAGGTMTVLTLLATRVQTHPEISQYHAANSYELGQGRNIVNVILVDFRALDTLGEITVLAIAAIGVLALLKFKPTVGAPVPTTVNESESRSESEFELESEHDGQKPGGDA